MRRYLFPVMLLLLALTSCKKEEQTSEVAQTPPNILYIMCDDHTTQAISAYEHPLSEVVETPNIDRLANEGIQFDRAFCTNALCGPSRAVLLTGKYSHKNGFRHNADKFDASQPTFINALDSAGYETAVIGKWHLKSTPQGFDHWEILPDQGKYYNPDFITKDGTHREEGYSTDIITDKTIAWMDKQRDKNKPFCLLMHHKAPHRNWMAAMRHLNKYDSVKFPVPENYLDRWDGRKALQEQEMTVWKDMYEGHDLKLTKTADTDELRFNPWTDDFDRLTPEQKAKWNEVYRKKNQSFFDENIEQDPTKFALWKYQRYMEEYLATCESVDESVGRVLDYLDKAGLAENTIVVFTSDQGFFLGEHGLFDKRFMYEETLRIPLLIRYPNGIKAGTHSDAMVMNLDFAPTFLDYAGLNIPEEMQGKSMKPVMSRDSAPKDWRDAVYYHYYEYPGFHSAKRQYGIRTDRYKLIHFYNDIDEWELYDLEKDPHEMNNVIDEVAYADVKKDMMAKLEQQMKQYDEPPYEEFKDTKLPLINMPRDPKYKGFTLER
ncbi:sulfatase [Limibacter armeniacum]|uniref:sulfatase family protein n=1 Tax=Limibacter armeniacum TaxID=466084 RepID=UPI002FE63E1F